MVEAFVNHGRWLVQCPRCSSAEAVFLGTLTWVCRDGNHAQMAGGVPEPVEVGWPKDVMQIQAALSVRPDPQNRNWKEPETVGDLERENREHFGSLIAH